MEVLQWISTVMMWLALGLNVYSAAINFRGYTRNQKLSKILSEQIKFWEEENKENNNDE